MTDRAPTYIYRPASDDSPEPGVARGWIVIHERPPEVGKPVETFDATVIVDPDGGLHVDVDWDSGKPGVITDD